MLKTVFSYFFHKEMSKDLKKIEPNDILEWIYLIISLIFQRNCDGFVYIYEILQRENMNSLKFNENHYNFFIFFYHISLKIIENREQCCLIAEFFQKYRENHDFLALQGKNTEKFGLFLIKKADFSRLIHFFNDLNKQFLSNLETFLQGNCDFPYKKDDFHIVLMNKQLGFLNIWLKVIEFRINFQ